MVIDASVLINLLALEPRHLEAVSRALSTPLLLTPQVQSEVRRDPRTRAAAQPRIDELLSAGVLTFTELDAPELDVSIELVSVDDLDDGEAATIAVAAHRSIIAVIDETKGLRIAEQRAVRCVSTVALMLGPECRRALGKALPDAVEAALHHARMHVAPLARPAIVELLGPVRAERFNQLRSAVREARKAE